MKLLLDTHVWLWSVAEPERLAPTMRSCLENPDTELWLSPMSIWELVMLAQKGRLELDVPVAQWVVDAQELVTLREAPVTREVALETALVDAAHKDPADRFLVATARVFGLRLATADGRLLRDAKIDTLAAAGSAHRR